MLDLASCRDLRAAEPRGRRGTSKSLKAARSCIRRRFTRWTARAANRLMGPGVNADIHDIQQSPSRAEAENALDRFSVKYGDRHDKAVACLEKDRDALLAFQSFPAKHWKHLRTTNPVESLFSSVRHRTVRTRGLPVAADSEADGVRACPCRGTPVVLSGWMFLVAERDPGRYAPGWTRGRRTGVLGERKTRRLNGHVTQIRSYLMAGPVRQVLGGATLLLDADGRVPHPGDRRHDDARRAAVAACRRRAGGRHPSALAAETALARGALIVVDEAHHLAPRLLDELRCIRDVGGCGLALIGVRLPLGAPAQADVLDLAAGILGRRPGAGESKSLIAAARSAGGLHALRRLMARAWVSCQAAGRDRIEAGDLDLATEAA